jgi:AcrR family transcriptional regulator
MRRRGPAPSLDLTDLVAEALELLDREGEDGFSIRNLADALGVSPMTVYNYVPTKAVLLDHVVDSVIDPIAPADPSATDWEAELRRYALDAWDAQVIHPWIPAYLASRRVTDRPAQVQARLGLHGLFARAGADEAAAREGVAVFFSFVIGSFVQVMPTVAEHGPTARSRQLFQSGLDIVIDGLRSRFARRPRAEARP